MAKRGRIPNKQTTVESFMIANGKEGDHFFSYKKDRHITAIAAHHNRKVKTERCIIIYPKKGQQEPECKNITKTTLL